MAVEQHSASQGAISNFFYRVAPAVWKRYWATRMMAISLTTHMDSQGGPRGVLMTLLVRKGLQYGWFLNGRPLPVDVQVHDYDDLVADASINRDGALPEASFNVDFDAAFAVEVKRICDGILALVKDGIDAGAHTPDCKFILVDSVDAGALFLDMSKILSLPEKGVDQVGASVWDIVSKAFVLSTNMIGQDIPVGAPGSKIGIVKDESAEAIASVFILYMTVGEMLKLRSEMKLTQEVDEEQPGQQ